MLGEKLLKNREKIVYLPDDEQPTLKMNFATLPVKHSVELAVK